MSTRAHILIKDGDEQVMLYHHHDGYPEGVGRKLKKFLAEQFPKYWDVCEIANGLVKGALRYPRRSLLSDKVTIESDMEYEITTGIHGDEAYVYIIDCDKHEIKCYRHKWDEGMACVVPEREVEIPEPEKEDAK